MIDSFPKLSKLRWCVLLFAASSCQTPSPTGITGIWLGSYSDETYRLPYPVVLDIKDDQRLTKVVFGDSNTVRQLDWDPLVLLLVFSYAISCPVVCVFTKLYSGL